ncbi:MAG TPA: hypothetical protein PKD49_07635 [Hyphomicrobium sp.]|nr:hypothetical protein [Hyphomicrobium sp.]
MDATRGRARLWTDAEVRKLEATLLGTREMMRLLNSGAGGISQLRRITKEKIEELESDLEMARMLMSQERTDET